MSEQRLSNSEHNKLLHPHHDNKYCEGSSLPKLPNNNLAGSNGVLGSNLAQSPSREGVEGLIMAGRQYLGRHEA